MHRYFRKGLPASCLFIFFLLLLSACKTVTPTKYFTDFPDTAKATVLKTLPFKNPLIQPDDVLSVTLQTIDQTVSAPVNTTNSTDAGTGTQALSGYLVDKDGQIELPFIGKIKVSGLTTSEARDTIIKAADKLFNSPIVNVRLVNFKVTVLGEVNRPSTYVMPSEKVTIFDAIGLAGDLTLYGKRESVLLMRDSTGDNRQVVRLDLNSKNIVSSPFFYLKPNDVVYIEPNQNRLASTDVATTRRFTILTTVLGVLTAVSILLSRL